MNEYRKSDIETGKIRTATFHAHGFYLEYYEHTPGKRSQLSGTHLSKDEYQALIENKVPVFHFEEKGAHNMPIILGPETDSLPWGSSSRVSADIGHSILAMTSDKHFNFEPIKIPLALFAKHHQEKLLKIAQERGTEDFLVDIDIPNAEAQYQNPQKYYEEVISKSASGELEKLAKGIIGKIQETEKKIASIAEAQKSNEDLSLLSQKHNLESQRKFLDIHLSKVNEAVLIGKANKWPTAQTLAYAKKSISEVNIRAQDVVDEQKREASPMDYARAEMARSIDGLIDKLFKFMADIPAFSR